MTTIASFESPHLEIPTDLLRDFCDKHHIRMLALFGSVIRDDFAEGSDIDVLVEFDAEHIPGFDFFIIQEELSELLGRDVDLNTPGFLSRHMRDAVQEEAVVLYDKTR